MDSRTALEEVSKTSGAFQRTASTFRNFIGSLEFPAASGRYHLYVSYACPWANRAIAVLKLKGLEDCIGMSVVHPTWQKTRPEDPMDTHYGWVFRKPEDEAVVPPSGFGSVDCEGCVADSVTGAKSIRELYEISEECKYTGKYTVPVLWDCLKRRIVNNESSEIILMLNSAFDAFAKHSELDLYPSELKQTIDEVNGWVYERINNGVYKCGFAKSQQAYEEAVEQLFAALDRAEDILSHQRFIASMDRLTVADIRLFMTLVRFDEVYIVYFKCDRRAIREYPNLLNYCRDLYSLEGIRESINMKHIKTHYFTSHVDLNKFSIIPVGPNFLQLLLLQKSKS